MKKIKIGILREEKIPADKRVPLPPQTCKELIAQYAHLEIIVQPSTIRCFKDEEYQSLGLTLQEDLSACDILMGVKEVPPEKLIPGKKYLFFSHTIKKQSYNQKLMKALITQKIEMIDYETLTDKHHNRIIGFGRFAGIVGAYNAFRGYGLKQQSFQLKPAHECFDKVELDQELQKITLPPIKIVLTGGGRVANGAIETLSELQIRKITPEEFIRDSFDEPVYCQLNPKEYVERIGDHNFDLNDFYTHPEHYQSTFVPYTQNADIFISAHYWDPRSPRLFSLEDLKRPKLSLKVIADITCDINGSVPTTHRASTIADPFYGFHPLTGKETPAFDKESICIMAVDNLPCELPRDASNAYGHDLSERVIDNLLTEDKDDIIKRATICKDGKLTPGFEYLSDYAYEKVSK